MVVLAPRLGGLMVEWMSNMPQHTVLVVDDDEDNALVLEAMLTSNGFVVRTAASCHEARTILATSSVDALVTDFSLGDGDAHQLLASLGSKPPRVSVVVTGFGSAEDRAKSHAAGFHAHFVKPIAFDELQKLLRTALGKDAT
jgi:DNA-binding NtrC family response regulator